MARLEHAAIAVALLVAFVADLRFVVPVVLGVLVWWTVRHAAERTITGGAALLLAGSTIAFAFDAEVLAWALALTVAVSAGISAARPRSAGASRVAGSSSRAR